MDNEPTELKTVGFTAYCRIYEIREALSCELDSPNQAFFFFSSSSSNAGRSVCAVGVDSHVNQKISLQLTLMFTLQGG